jgi:SAM-dependent methyltransferase
VRRADFTALAAADDLPGAPFDAVLLLYDGLNYVLDPARLPAIFAGAASVLRPGGLFVVDQTTPANSAAHADAFDDAGRDPVHAADGPRAFAYVRHSRYDAEAGLHTTTLDLTVGGRTVREEHVQRVYAPRTLRAVIDAQPRLAEEAAYDGFTRDAAHAGSYRVHWVLRRGF